MKHRGLLVVVLVLLGVALLAGVFLATFQRRDVVEPVPPSGMAQTNPFFALEQVLRDMGEPAASLTTLDPGQAPLQPGDTVLVGADAGRIDAETAARLASWVRRGGHLLLVPDAGTRAPVFAALDLLDPRPGGFGCSRLGDEKMAASLCGLRFRLKPAVVQTVDAAIGDAGDGYLFARTAVGRGQVSLLASLAPLERLQLKHAEAQRFAWRLLAPNRGRGQIYLVYALDGQPFLKLLATQGWPALLALALLLAAWMAMRGARCGPLMPAPAPHRRALLEHVQAAGEFLYRRDGGRSLHQLACQAVLARLRRRDPASVRLNGEALYGRLAERGGLDAAQVAQAFQSPANAQAFRASLITLARLRSRP
ncbi:DUF4350 domain-containing protein [Rhodanobacter sp. 7MK24]|uniref:DUF4350 domain-containing protein n=1 Tax=Rhodanobacter sp. 7MK24 TaxID=2775922 RepID=UPI0017855D40|nr:DUF4350 domain-containing protein [Rhodanobacter sp. 7MK24]MBD8878932.1 DUF4350 domain-containing protein [Rhodanobacter sp. 7MK24]